MQNYSLPNEKPLCDTWGVKKNADSWDLALEFDFDNKSVREHNIWYAETFRKTIEAFSSIARVSGISFDPIDSISDKHKGVALIWQQDRPYEEYIKTVLETIEKYPNDIDYISLGFDFFIYIRTEKSFPKPVRAWVGEFGKANILGHMTIDLSIKDEEAGILFSVNHTLFYPFYYPTGEDNMELFNLNQPLLEEALRNWEQKFDAEIEADGSKGIYKYGYLPEDQW